MPRKKSINKKNTRVTKSNVALNTKPQNKPSHIFISRGLKESLFFVLIAIATLLSISLYSFSPLDPGWSHSESERIVHEVTNMGGRIGSFFADYTFLLLGYMAFMLPLLPLGLAWKLYTCSEFSIFRASLRALGFILTITAGCGLATIHFSPPLIIFPSDIGSGGILGQEIAEFIKLWFSYVGATILLLTLFLVGVTLFTHLSWIKLMDIIGKYSLQLFNSLLNLSMKLYHMVVREVQSQKQQFQDSSSEQSEQTNKAYPQDKKIETDTEAERETKLEINQSYSSESNTLNSLMDTNEEHNTQSSPQDSFQDSSQDKAQNKVKSFLKKIQFKDIRDNLKSIISNFKQETKIDEVDALVSEAQNSKKIDPLFNKVNARSKATKVVIKQQERESEQIASFVTTTHLANEEKTHVKKSTAVGIDEVVIVEPQEDKINPIKKPIKIQTADQPVEESNRALNEKQKQLFQHDILDTLPALSLLDTPKPPTQFTTAEELEHMSRQIEEKLAEFNMKVEVVAVQQGPVITRFELQLAPGIKVSQLSNLSKDLARALLVVSIRIVEVIAGKSTVGIEIPNEYREIVSFYNVLNSVAYGSSKALLPLALGNDISGQPVVTDLAKMPHLLVAGTTGSGKSVGINSMILSLLFHSNPGDLRLIMIDPKMLELSIYEGIPHLLCPVVTDMMEAANALRWCVAEMERRYKLLSALGVRNIAGYNKKVKDACDAGEPILDPLFEPNPMAASLRPDELDTLPYIVIIIDEFADMMMIVGKKVEELIARLAQKARAAGLHLIIATQRPSVNVITGLIKANVPTRLAFQVSTKIDSRTILDQMGAESLLGNGDMLFLPPGTGMPQRIHGAFVSDEEVHAVVDDLKERGNAEYIEEILSGDGVESPAGINMDTPGNETDPLYDQAVAIVIESRKASISSVQRRLKVGYNRAARMVEDMEAAGVVSKVQSNGQREVIAPSG